MHTLVEEATENLESHLGFFALYKLNSYGESKDVRVAMPPPPFLCLCYNDDYIMNQMQGLNISCQNL